MDEKRFVLGLPNGEQAALTAAELVAFHRQVTLWMASAAGQAFLRDAGIEYRAKICSAPERHPEWEACRRQW